MSTIYLCIVIFLLCLAVFDLFVGVSNDAVNFLQSAIGAKVAKFRTVLIIVLIYFINVYIPYYIGACLNIDKYIFPLAFPGAKVRVRCYR